MAAFVLYQGPCVVVTETARPVKPETCISWPFTEKMCSPPGWWDTEVGPLVGGGEGVGGESREE